MTQLYDILHRLAGRDEQLHNEINDLQVQDEMRKVPANDETVKGEEELPYA